MSEEPCRAEYSIRHSANGQARARTRFLPWQAEPSTGFDTRHELELMTSLRAELAHALLLARARLVYSPSPPAMI